MESLLKKSGYKPAEITQKMAKLTPVLSRYSYTVEQKILTGLTTTFDTQATNSDTENRQMLGLLGGSPLISGYMILNDCYEKGLKQVLRDDDLWNVEGTALKGASTLPTKTNAK